MLQLGTEPFYSFGMQIIRLEWHMYGRSLTYMLGPVLCVMVASSCATSASRQTYWFNPAIENHLQQARFTLDSTQCLAEAREYIPPSEDTIAPNAFEAGRRRVQRERSRDEYALACMVARGWEERTVDEQ